MTIDTDTTDLRPSRRTITRAAAWSVPVIAAAATAPAYAASPCDVRVGQLLDWDGTNASFNRTSNTAATLTLDSDGAGPVLPMSLDVTAAYTGNMKPGSETAGSTPNPNFRIAPRVGGLGVSGLSLWQATTSSSPQGLGDLGTYTFTFSRPVSNLEFTITDIDSQDTDFLDLLRISASYVVLSKSSSVLTTTDGQGREYFYQSYYTNAADNAEGSGGNLTLRLPGPLTSFQIAYSNYARSFDNTLDQDQAIYVSDMTFDYSPC